MPVRDIVTLANVTLAGAVSHRLPSLTAPVVFDASTHAHAGALVRNECEHRLMWRHLRLHMDLRSDKLKEL